MDGEAWLQSELAAFACAACGQAYGEGRVRLIAQREELFFVDLVCGHCGSQAVAIVTIQVDDDGITLEAGELVPAEPVERRGGASRGAEAGADADPLTADDVLDAHFFLQGFRGDARALLARLGSQQR